MHISKETFTRKRPLRVFKKLESCFGFALPSSHRDSKQDFARVKFCLDNQMSSELKLYLQNLHKKEINMEVIEKIFCSVKNSLYSRPGLNSSLDYN